MGEEGLIECIRLLTAAIAQGMNGLAKKEIEAMQKQQVENELVDEWILAVEEEETDEELDEWILARQRKFEPQS